MQIATSFDNKKSSRVLLVYFWSKTFCFKFFLSNDCLLEKQLAQISLVFSHLLQVIERKRTLKHFNTNNISRAKQNWREAISRAKQNWQGSSQTTKTSLIWSEYFYWNYADKTDIWLIILLFDLYYYIYLNTSSTGWHLNCYIFDTTYISICIPILLLTHA